MRPLLASLIAACSLLALAGPLAAQELKIGYVNSERLWRDSAPAKTAQARLDAEFLKRGKDLDDMAARLKAASDKLNKDDPALSEDERTRRQRALVEQDREFQRRRREFQEDRAQRRNEEQAVLFERADRAIKLLSEQEKYDLIVQDAVYASSRVDITDKVIRLLNSTSSVATTAPSAGK